MAVRRLKELEVDGLAVADRAVLERLAREWPEHPRPVPRWSEPTTNSAALPAAAA